MAVRRFGPVQAAGVQIEEKEPDKQIQAAPLGVTAVVGEFERGTPGEPGFPGGLKSFNRRYGSRTPSSEAPSSCEDFYRLGRGAGELIPWRVTAGDEVGAVLEVWNRAQVLDYAVITEATASLELTARAGGKTNLRYEIVTPAGGAPTVALSGNVIEITPATAGSTGSAIAAVINDDATIGALVAANGNETGTFTATTAETSFTQGTAKSLHSTWVAKNGGKWGGQRKFYVDEITGVNDLTPTSLDTGDTMIENEWVGGTLQLKKVGTKTYRITGNTAAGVISLEADQDLVTDWTAASGTPANRYVLTRENVDHLGNEKHLALLFVDGQENPGSEWGVEIYVDGSLVNQYRNLSSDPTSPRYFLNVINDDPSNYEVTVNDLYSGDKTVASARPANYHGQSLDLNSTTLWVSAVNASVSSTLGADPAVSVELGSLAGECGVVGEVFNTGADILWTVFQNGVYTLAVTQTSFTGVETDIGDEVCKIRVTNGSTSLADGDVINLKLTPLVPNEAVGGKIWPDVENEPDLSFQIVSNTRDSISVRTGLDLTDDGAIEAGAVYRVEYQEELEGGHDGSATTEADYLAAFDSVSSTLNKIFGKNKGLVKMSTPGVVSATVQKAGLEYAAARNYQYYVEIPSNVTAEDAAVNHINTTIGRSDYGFTYFPSFGYISDPDATPGSNEVALKEVSMAGMILGRHALVAKNYNGYHKAPAGIDVTLPDILLLPTGGPETASILNEEILNPKGVNVIKFRQGSVIIWGDRTISPDSGWQWLHQRSLMSYYENVLRENFDWIIFALNNPETQERLKTTIRAYFLPEWQKGAIRGDEFEGDAMKLKIDDENNTDLTRSLGDLNAEITLRLADTVERLKIVIGKAGIFDAVE